MNDHDSPRDCPSFEDLSAWFDGESACSEIDMHLGHCRTCSDLLDQMASYSDLELPAPDAGTISRIVYGTQEQLVAGDSKPAEEELLAPPPLLSFGLIVRLAAAAAVVLLVFELRSNLNQAQQQLANQPVLPAPDLPVITVGGAAVETAGKPEETVPQPLASRAFSTQPAGAERPAIAEAAEPAAHETSGTSHDVRGVRFVGLSTGQVDGVGETNMPAGSRAVASVVRHLWVSEDAADLISALSEMMPREVDRKALAEAAAQQQDQYSLRFVAPDRDVQRIVNTLSASGASLLSPGQPQPGGEPASATFSGRDVLYRLDFVRR